jgi:hypothetical protein
MDWKEKAKEIHKKEKEQAKQKLKEKVIKHLQKDRMDMSGWGVGQISISALECEVILDLLEKEKNNE